MRQSLPFARASLAVLGVFLLSSTLHAAPPEHLWTGEDGKWETAENWDPATVPDKLSMVIIDKRVEVDADDVVFSHTGEGMGGKFIALTLDGGARLKVSGNLTVLSAAAAPNTAVRGVRIGEESTLDVAGTLTTGVQNASGATSIWTISGTVTADQFAGAKTRSETSEPRLAGGYILNVDGGKLTVRKLFDWADDRATHPGSTGQIHLRAGGEMTVGAMAADWTSSTENYINFADETGRLVFGKENWPARADVEGLIEKGFLRVDRSVARPLDIREENGAWVVAVKEQ